MLKNLLKSLLLLLFSVAICCGVYPLALWTVGQVFFPFQANGSLLKGPDGKIIGSKLIAQPFTREEYFSPRPSAASFDGSASASSSLAASNPALRDRAARMLAQVVKYRSGPKAGQLVAPDIGSISFNKWREDHPDVDLEDVPADMVTTSASGLDPHISLENAEFQLNRVALKWASNLNKDPVQVKKEIRQILMQNAMSPLCGLAGEKLINVLEVNLALCKFYGRTP